MIFAPATNTQTWDEELLAQLARLGRLAAPGCTVATWSAASGVRDGLTRAGFTVHPTPGASVTAFMRVQARLCRPLPAASASTTSPPTPCGSRGCRLGGAVSCWALARAGWQVTLFDKHPQPASEASGNPGGMFHAIVHGEDGIHARAHRAAALAVDAAVKPGWKVVNWLGNCRDC